MKDIYDFRTNCLQDDIITRWKFAQKHDTHLSWQHLAYFLASITYLMHNPYAKVGGSQQARAISSMNMLTLESIAEQRALMCRSTEE